MVAPSWCSCSSLGDVALELTTAGGAFFGGRWCGTEIPYRVSSRRRTCVAEGGTAWAAAPWRKLMSAVLDFLIAVDLAATTSSGGMSRWLGCPLAEDVEAVD
ncbi:unnamed protein product [Calypogeia fissa]